MEEKVLIDTNCLLRYLTNDLPDQANRVKHRFRQARDQTLEISIEAVVIAETLFQLTKWAKLSRQEASGRLIRLISAPWLSVSSKREFLEALAMYGNKKMDFVDLLVWAKANSQGKQVLSFDHDFDKLEPSLRLEP